MLWFKKKKKPDTDKLLQAVKQLVRAQTLDQITDKALPWPESGHTFHSQDTFDAIDNLVGVFMLECHKDAEDLLWIVTNKVFGNYGVDYLIQQKRKAYDRSKH